MDSYTSFHSRLDIRLMKLLQTSENLGDITCLRLQLNAKLTVVALDYFLASYSFRIIDKFMREWYLPEFTEPKGLLGWCRFNI